MVQEVATQTDRQIRSDQKLFQYLVQYEYYYIIICILVLQEIDR